MYDIIIVGAGPAGLTAAIYARRANKTVLILDKGAFGGQIAFSPKVENYPGFETVTGAELADKMVEQALFQGADVEVEEVLEIKDI
jgi:thioredoxin reductase (NADPH)